MTSIFPPAFRGGPAMSVPKSGWTTASGLGPSETKEEAALKADSSPISSGEKHES